MAKTQPTPSNWRHSRFGEFKASSGGWSRKINVPEFAAFSFDTGYSNAPRSTGDIQLGIDYFKAFAEVPATPPREMVALLDALMADPRALVDRVVGALWEEFNGRGPESGVWWRGDMEAVNKQFKNAGLPAPKGPRGLLPALQLTMLSIFNEWWDYPSPIGYLDFRAAFEREHGLSMLCDTERILGMGFSAGDVMLWKHLRPERPPSKNPFV